MSKRPHSSQAPASAPEDLVQHLKAAGNDAALLRGILESNDSASVAAALAALLTSPSTKAVSDVKRRKKARSQQSIPNETIVEIVLFADRDALDAWQLVCLFVRDFIHNREANELPLRPVAQVRIGKFSRPKPGHDYWPQHWLPAVAVARGSDFEVPDSVNRLVPYLRLAYCQSVYVDLRLTRCVREQLREAAYGAIFGDLILPNTSVELLEIYVDDGSAIVAHRAFKAFEALSKVVVKMDGRRSDPDWARSFDETFFISAAKCGVRSISFDTGSQYWIDINVLPALSFGFAEPTAGGDRSISSVFCALEDEDFLAQLIEKASELDGRQHIDFTFTIEDLSEPIDPAGYEKYQNGEWSWLIDDLENGITVEIEEAEHSTEIHVFSSV
ncbi:hypothetical protein AAVH_28389 [Aphelenchoides avenae]|nr:hypothetical protein AAVH_28389 [Aphelenchus avenae]